jgi:hypothetical protein
MYAKIASTDYEDYEKFAAEAVTDMKEKRPGSNRNASKPGKPRVASFTSSMTIRRRKPIPATSGSRMFSYPRPSLTLSFQQMKKRTSANTKARCPKR